MRELTEAELNDIVGGNQAEGGGAIIATAGIALMIVGSPVAVPLVAVAILGVACGVAIGMAMDN
ncbi:MAG: hypothetical protein ABL973_21145 [Micropepsaceae bacterium]